VPGRIVDPADAGNFVGESQPIPVRTLPLSTLSLSPFKLATIATFSNELARFSGVQRIITQILTEAFALRLDTELLSSTTLSSTRPAGLQNGLSPIAAATAGSEAMMTDIGALVGALATGGGGDPIFICSPKQAATLRAKVGPQFSYPILASKALAAGNVVAVEASGLVFGFSPVPEFDVTSHAALHMEDATPAPLVTGTGPTVATPVRSLWQTDCTAIRAILRLTWGLRGSGLVQTVTGTNW
jgi:hypothetical protein